MIVSIALTLLIAGTLLTLLNKTEIPEIPIYITSGILLSILSSVAFNQRWISGTLVEKELMLELALLGLGILVFYSTSGKVLDRNRKTSVSSFRTALWLSSVSFIGFTGISLYAGFDYIPALIFGLTASVGSTLMDSGLVKEEARKNHIHGWITEDMDFYDDLFTVVILTAVFGLISGLTGLYGGLISLIVITSALVLRKYYSKLILYLTGGENELILLSGITTLIAFTWITEEAGVSALAGIYAAGLIIADTELGFKIRERFSAVKDFFLALSFFAVGYLITLPEIEYILMASGLVIFTSFVRPLLATQALKLQGYDLRTGFMANIQSAQISEIALLASILMRPFIGDAVFETLTIAFVTSIIIAHIAEDREQVLFEKLFSSYELDSEKTSIPRDLEDHVILAGFDWKTRGLEEIIERDVIVVDYDLENIEEAEERNLPHLLADLYTEEAWEKASVDDASVIASAISDPKLIDRIDEMDVEAEKVLVEKDSEDVKNKLREMLSDSLK